MLKDMNYEDKSIYLRGDDLVYPERKDYSSYTIKDLDTMTVTENVTKAELQKMNLTFANGKFVQQNRYVVELVFDHDGYDKVKDVYSEIMTKRYAEFDQYLIDKYGVTDIEKHNKIYSKAYDDKHSQGHLAIEEGYADLVSFLKDFGAV